MTIASLCCDAIGPVLILHNKEFKELFFADSIKHCHAHKVPPPHFS